MLFLICSLLFACSAPESGPQETPEDKPDEPQVQTDVLPAVAADPMSWVALAPDGTWMEEYPAEHIAKTVGIFYFLWHGCHGYDKFENNNYVKYPGPNDIHSPYNNEEIYSANPANPTNPANPANQYPPPGYRAARRSTPAPAARFGKAPMPLPSPLALPPRSSRSLPSSSSAVPHQRCCTPDPQAGEASDGDTP